MARNAAIPPTYDTLLETIRAWPAAQRLTLVQDVLATLTPEVAGAPRQPTLSRAIGLLATDTPPPTDDEIARVLDERRQERYGQ